MPYKPYNKIWENAPVEMRKLDEQDLHDMLRSDDLKMNEEKYKYYTSNSKFYSIDRGNKEYVNNWLKRHVKGKKVLDYCCGDGRYTFRCAEYGGDAIGIDISNVTIANCRREAKGKKIKGKVTFLEMDAENTEFDSDSFDFAICMGVLHHLDIEKAFRELFRIIKPNGKIICTEALGHNPLIQVYRNRTPHLRTEYESQHILKNSDVRKAYTYFGSIKKTYFHLATLAAVPFRKTMFFDVLLNTLELIDAVLLRLPLVRTQAWMFVFELSEPKKKERSS
jgi:ubiquinone/menaquinone biosynthesis C-methylase UbiE